MAKKKHPFPHTYVIVFSLIVLGSILTWIVPGGRFARQDVEVNGVTRSVVVPGSYEQVPSCGQSYQIFTALFDGMTRTSSIIFYILIIGGAFWILNSSHALDVAIGGFVRSARRLERQRWLRFIGIDNLIVTLIMLCFSFFGAVIGMSEETIAFVVIFVPLAISMGYDSIVGVSMCFLAAGLGFAGALLNPFTIGIAQGLAGLPLFSGLGYRLVIWAAINFVGISYVLRYMRRLRRDPTLSPVYGEDAQWRARVEENQGLKPSKAGRAGWGVYVVVLLVLATAAILYPITTLGIGAKTSSWVLLPPIAATWAIAGYYSTRHSVQMLNVGLLLLAIVVLVVGVMGYKWYIQEIASLFLAMGIATGIAAGQGANAITKLFIAGAADILSAALVVGFASGIVVILEQGQIIDTLLAGAADAMAGFGTVGAVVVMYIFYTLLNLIIASGSAKAALTIPLMAQFADLVGLSRQTAVTAYQLGGGFTNLATPTSGVMVGVLAMAHIPYVKWLKWFWPLLVLLMVLGLLLLLPTVLIQLQGF